MIYRGITLDRFQEEAIGRIHENASILVAAPTGAGKTLVAEYAVEKCISEGKRIIYTAPIKPSPIRNTGTLLLSMEIEWASKPGM